MDPTTRPENSFSEAVLGSVGAGRGRKEAVGWALGIVVQVGGRRWEVRSPRSISGGIGGENGEGEGE